MILLIRQIDFLFVVHENCKSVACQIGVHVSFVVLSSPVFEKLEIRVNYFSVGFRLVVISKFDVTYNSNAGGGYQC